ncbi:MAG: hypothetical protein ACE5GW_03090 [Planctomycetota bacterium]
MHERSIDPIHTRRAGRWHAAAALPGLLLLLHAAAPASGQAPPAIVDTTINDFFQPGTQPETLNEPVIAGAACTLCHASFDPETAPYDRWSVSIMAQAGRDPLFWACLAIAEQDAAASGDLCLRCHAPSGWLEGRSVPTDGSALTGINDFDGVTCDHCHRMVDAVYTPGVSPPDDLAILNALTDPPVAPHSGQYIVDPNDIRRGPFDLVPGFGFHEWRRSPFHRDAAMCGTCHDVSNPVFVRQGDSYVPGDLDTPHPSHDRYEEFPVERTYSEWLASAFAQGPIDMGGRFGGNLTEVSSCQDCHMPDASGYGCSFTGSSIFRNDLPRHDLNGSHTWVLDSIMNLDATLELYDTPAYMSPLLLDAAKARNVGMLEAASDMELSREGAGLKVRIINQSGHKLPSGYPEGRRIWINVRFLDGAGEVIQEHGHYDFDSALLATNDTKVYETKLGLDETMAAATGLPEGESFHFALNNKIYKDNRIPPRGFTNAGFEAVQAAPVAYAYADGVHWDDTLYPIPPASHSAEVTVYYQTASREYIDFLRDENITNNAGEVLHTQWELSGKGPPVAIDSGYQSLAACGPETHTERPPLVQSHYA